MTFDKYLMVSVLREVGQERIVILVALFKVDIVETASLFISQVLKVVAAEAIVRSVIGNHRSPAWQLCPRFMLRCHWGVRTSSRSSHIFLVIWRLDDELFVHSSRKEINERRVILVDRSQLVQVGVCVLLFNFLFLVARHSEEEVNKSKSEDDEANHELHNLERHVSLLLKIEFLIERVSVRVQPRFHILLWLASLSLGHSLLKFLWHILVRECVNVNLFFSYVYFRAIFCSFRFNDDAWLLVKFPLVSWSSLNVAFITEDSNELVNGVNVNCDIGVLWCVRLVEDLVTLFLECIKDARELRLDIKTSPLTGHIIHFVLNFLGPGISFFNSFVHLLFSKRWPLFIDFVLKVHEITLLFSPQSFELSIGGISSSGSSWCLSSILSSRILHEQCQSGQAQ